MSDFNQEFQSFLGGSATPSPTVPFEDSYKAFLVGNSYAKKSPLPQSQTQAPQIGQVQIKPNATKIDLNQIGNSFLSTAKNFIGAVKTAENVIGTLKFVFKNATTPTTPQEVKTQNDTVANKKSYLEGNLQSTKLVPDNGLVGKIVDAIAEPGLRFGQLGAGAEAAFYNKLGIKKGIGGNITPDTFLTKEEQKMYTDPKTAPIAITKRIAGAVTYVLPGSGLLGGAVAGGLYGFSDDHATPQSVAISTVAGSVLGFAVNKVGEVIVPKIQSFIKDLKPINFTIQDLKDVNGVAGVKPTIEQLAKYQRIVQLADQKGISIADVLKFDSKNPGIKLYDFLKNSIDELTTYFKPLFTADGKKVSQNLLESGATKSEIEKVIQTGEHTPQELLNNVMANNLENTAEGKQVIKMVAEAQTNGQNIVVDSATPAVQEVANAGKAGETGITPVAEAPHPAEQIKIEQVKTMKDVKRSLNNVKGEFDNLLTEAQGNASLAQEQRAGINTEDVAKLKRIYSASPKFQAGDIETIRASKTGDLLNKVIENIQEKNPTMSEQEAFDYAISLPTKANEVVKNTPQMRDLIKRQKDLTKYLDSITQKQQELLGTTQIKQGDQLYQEWKDALMAQEKLAKIIQVPRESLPVGQGEQAVSRLEARVKKTLDNTTQENIDSLGLGTYNKMNNADQIRSAVDYVSKNPADALKVLQGDIEAPKGILKNSIYVAMDQLATDDSSLALKLASLQSTRYGQEIQILKELNPDSPVKIMKDIVEVREKAFQEKFKGQTAKQAIKKEVENIKKAIKAPDKYDWSSFLDTIECK